MKKLFNSRFLFILASSLVVLIALGVGAFYLFDDSDDIFIKSGYVLNPLSSTFEKYFFNENTEYKENLSSMVEFKDVDENEVSILKDSFLHYMDDSLSFLKKGAILDLDSIDGKSAVSFYNITNESIIEKDGNGYKIESASGDIKLNNFIGRINDNKYIVVGDLNLKMAGNSTLIKGDYFEIVYVEEGIVNIENKDVKYQVTADETFIYVGSDVVIDLGDKKITVDDEDVMSITAITIDGDENIEIIPKGNEEEDGATGNDGQGDGDGDGTGTGDGDGTGDGSGDGDGTGDEDGNLGTDGDGTDGGDGTGGTGNENVETEITQEVTVSLKEAEIGSTSIDVTFDVANEKEEDKFMLQVVNLTTGRTVDMVAQVLADVPIKVNLLTPNTKYLFMVVNEKDNGKYFQKVFETTDFGIKLEKSYATDSTLAYKVTVGEGTDITNAKLSLYKYNEETKQNEIVKTSYVDSTTGEVVYDEKITYLSNMGENIEGEHEIVYSGLDSDTIYTAVLDEFSVASSNFKDIYNITNTSMTLKKTPKFSEMTITKDVGDGSFDLSLGNIIDDDNAIVNYKYVIYESLTNEKVVEIDKNNASPLTVSIGDGEKELKNDTNYYYNVIIEYFDNEKYIEYVTTDSITFMMGSDPYVTVVPDEKKITHNQIGATIYLTDNSCLIAMPGREKCGGASSTVVEVSKVNPVDGTRTIVYSKLVTFEVDEEIDEIKYELLVDNLQAGYTYSVEVKANYGDGNSIELKELQHTDESKRTIATKALASFEVDWENRMGNEERVVDASAQFIPYETSGSLSGDESIKAIDEVIIKIYEGRSTNDLDTKLPLGTKYLTNNNLFSIEEEFYDNHYAITSDETFHLSYDTLLEIGEGELSKYYTIKIDAYTANGDAVNLSNNVLVYRVNPALFVNVDATLETTSITKKASGLSYYDSLTNGATVVGYNLLAAWGTSEMKTEGMKPNAISFTVINSEDKALKFYMKNKDGELELINGKFTYKLGSEYDPNGEAKNFYETAIYIDYGTEYEVVDDILRRGNFFKIEYDLQGKDAAGETFNIKTTTDTMYVPKETPSVSMYVASSDDKSITYKYSVIDPDNALYKEAEDLEYSFYVSRNEVEKKIAMKKVSAEGEVKKFEDMTDGLVIDNLYTGEFYKLFYKINTMKTGDPEADILDYVDGADDGIRMFEGYYDASENNISSYNFRYEIINNEGQDNRVIIKILADERILSRILNFRVTFSDDKNHKLEKNLWELSTCEGDKTTDPARCLSVDYTELNNADMMFNTISVKVEAFYDNGLMGYDFKVGNDGDFEYCIMQNNSSSFGAGSYITYTASGTATTIWTSELGIQKGYYTYSLGKTGTMTYTSHFNSSFTKALGISLSLTSIGYSSKNGIVNPKMISIDEMQCGNGEDNCNTFSFSSITPKVEVSLKTQIVNGSVMNLKLSGVDLDGFLSEEKDNIDNYYLYIEVWDNEDDAKNNRFENIVRPTLKVNIDKDKPTNVIEARIDNLKEYSGSNNTGTYYFNVYYKNKSGKLIQLFDYGNKTSYTTKVYTLTSLTAGNLFNNKAVSFTPAVDENVDKDNYGNRVLNTQINLNSYKNGIPYNFDIIYEICDKDKANAGLCGPLNYDNSDYILRKEIARETFTSVVTDKYDISDIDDVDGKLEYGKDYYMYIYVQFDSYYVSDDGSFEIEKRHAIINNTKLNFTLRRLSEPELKATRKAVLLDDGSSAIDLGIVVTDDDRTLDNGSYYIRVLDDEGNEVAGTNDADMYIELQFIENGNITVYSGDYKTYAFNAFDTNKQIRLLLRLKDESMQELVRNKKFVVTIYSTATVNNYGEDKNIDVDSNDYAIYTTNDYGVSIGEVDYSTTEKSFIAYFDGGANFDYVTGVQYSVLNKTTSLEHVSGYYDINTNKQFELYSGSDTYRFIINPDGLQNSSGAKYIVSMNLDINHPVYGEVTLTSEHIPSLTGEPSRYTSEDELK